MNELGKATSRTCSRRWTRLSSRPGRAERGEPACTERAWPLTIAFLRPAHEVRTPGQTAAPGDVARDQRVPVLAGAA